VIHTFVTVSSTAILTFVAVGSTAILTFVAVGSIGHEIDYGQR